MTVEDFLNVLSIATRIRIMKEKETLWTGYQDMLRAEATPASPNTENLKIYEQVRDKEIKHFAAVPEMRHKKWKELGLMSPIEPDKLPEYIFSDLRMDIYYTIYI